jgi:hypothetical protein
MIQRQNRELCGRAERTVGLCPVTPHCAPDPLRWHAVADLINAPGAIAMRNDPRIRHAKAEGVLTLLDIAGVYAGGRDPNTELACCAARPRTCAEKRVMLSGQG